MNKENISGDLKMVFGSPIPDEENIDIPPKASGEKVIEEGTIILELEDNTPEVVEEYKRQHHVKEDREH